MTRVRLGPDYWARRTKRAVLPPEFDWDIYFQKVRDWIKHVRLPNIVNHNECKYIIGNLHAPHTRYCGRPVMAGKSWCEKHHKLCTRVLVTTEEFKHRRRRHR